jgi:hypothetical protein
MLICVTYSGHASWKIAATPSHTGATSQRTPIICLNLLWHDPRIELCQVRVWDTLGARERERAYTSSIDCLTRLGIMRNGHSCQYRRQHRSCVRVGLCFEAINNMAENRITAECPCEYLHRVRVWRHLGSGCLFFLCRSLLPIRGLEFGLGFDA